MKHGAPGRVPSATRPTRPVAEQAGRARRRRAQIALALGSLLACSAPLVGSACRGPTPSTGPIASGPTERLPSDLVYSRGDGKIRSLFLVPKDGGTERRMTSGN